MDRACHHCDAGRRIPLQNACAMDLVNVFVLGAPVTVGPCPRRLIGAVDRISMFSMVQNTSTSMLNEWKRRSDHNHYIKVDR